MGHVLVFDSGVGGLSVVAELRKLMPSLYLSYVADDIFRPYGDKSEAQLKTRLPGLLKTLIMALKPDAVVIACNTASTTALAEIRAEIRLTLKVPIIGVVPAIKPAAQISQSKTIAVLGTPGTVKRKYVDTLIADYADGCQVILHGSTGLVELAERKLVGDNIDISEIEAEITPMFSGKYRADIDVVVLACTHFPLLLDELAAVTANTTMHQISWIDSGAAIAKRTQSVLKALPKNLAPNHPQTSFLISGQNTKIRNKMFAQYGFKKTVIL